MANQEDEQQQQQQEENGSDQEEAPNEEFDSDSDSSDGSAGGGEYYASADENEELSNIRPGDEIPEWDNTPEINIRRFTRLLESNTMKKLQEEEDEDYIYHEDLYDFPDDPEKWTEEDLKELWADAPLDMTKPGWDPVWADEDDWEVVEDEIRAGRDPPIAPFYLPYRKPYPAIPDNHFDISNPKAVVEELDRMEEFLTWVSYIFPDLSSYEGTIWDDLAHGKGVYIAEQGLVRYEGEWLQNNMEGHGVVEVDIPDIEPIPGSKLEAQMRAEGKIISRDFMSPEDKRWLEMDIEDSIRLAGDQYEIPFYENEEWIKQFGRKPEKGRYRYAGQWKHGRMHGCGLYEVNERPIYGRFYFGELLENSEGCDEETVALHAGLAEVAAAKARMFVNKPDGMVREARGPYSDPQHPYFYEEEDVWMAPGFINQFYEVPDFWKTYVHEIDQEREIWLNSFYRSPFRIPMPAELEYCILISDSSQMHLLLVLLSSSATDACAMPDVCYNFPLSEEPPEFVLVNKEPEPDPEDPSKLIYTEDPLILHTPTGRLINYIEDEKYGVRLFWQPPLKEGEDVDPEKIEFLPLGFDEFYGREEVKENPNMGQRLVMAVENTFKPMFDKLGKWAEEKKNASEMKLKVIEKELELVEAELCLEEALEEMDEELSLKEKEEEKKMEMGLEEEEEDTSALAGQTENATAKLKEDEDKVEVAGEDRDEDEDEEEEEEEEEEEDDAAPSSFGTVTADQSSTKDVEKGKKPGKSPFSSSSLSFASCSLVSSVPSRLQQSFVSWKQGRLPLKPATSCIEVEDPKHRSVTVNSVSFPLVVNQRGRLRAIIQSQQKFQKRNHSNGKISQFHSSSRVLTASRSQNQSWLHGAHECDLDSILSLQTPMCYLKSYKDTIGIEYQ
ncbi:hypothetical protein EZV62_002274 [Acer yangbiense]|uniref:MORN repeat-containing protein n=1 Tax=Acer yangbiense TaxID=1000413 RepID=A0A5C7IWT8_9ROSI|nr:hypothetical protein EZV62_002274 [Acer yangbiense]